MADVRSAAERCNPIPLEWYANMQEEFKEHANYIFNKLGAGYILIFFGENSQIIMILSNREIYT